MIEKQFKNLNEQIEIFKHKGMIIQDESYAKQVLLRENYFFLNGYRHLFYKSNDEKKFINGTTFEELYSLFLFDRSFRNIIFKYLLVIENNLKSITSYQLSKKYGYRERDYLRAKNFTHDPARQRQVNDLLKKMKRQIRINGSQHSATLHYVSNYGYIPLWILVKVLSFGIVSEMFSILKPEDQEEIGKIYNVEVDDLLVYLPILANYRNLCAHEDILYENRTQKQIDDTIYHQILDIPKENGEYIYGKQDLFALLIIMRQMLIKEDFKNMTIELENVVQTLNYNLTSIKIEKVLHRMGFPENWKDLAGIERSVDKE
ncbi:MAG: Abi family protein [bacterium]|nr:Abi family protein [Mycoplasmatota bacterium]MDD6757430.1 Abi family protein [bacterium]MDY2907817.1 Abi family protein [Candidatus Faecimonas sp.]